MVAALLMPDIQHDLVATELGRHVESVAMSVFRFIAGDKSIGWMDDNPFSPGRRLLAPYEHLLTLYNPIRT